MKAIKLLSQISSFLLIFNIALTQVPNKQNIHDTIIYSSFFDNRKRLNITNRKVRNRNNIYQKNFDRLTLNYCEFDSSISFSNTTIKSNAMFIASKFNSTALFSNVAFNNCTFSISEFRQEATFSVCNFDSTAFFSHAKFYDLVNFSNSRLDNANFSGAQFDDIAFSGVLNLIR
jgi:uncharacterized protein YjbI with pentapeptide repeats